MFPSESVISSSLRKCKGIFCRNNFVFQQTFWKWCDNHKFCTGKKITCRFLKSYSRNRFLAVTLLGDSLVCIQVMIQLPLPKVLLGSQKEEKHCEEKAALTVCCLIALTISHLVGKYLVGLTPDLLSSTGLPSFYVSLQPNRPPECFISVIHL